MNEKQETMNELIAAFLDYLTGAGYSPMTVTSYRETLVYWRKYLAEKRLSRPDQITAQVAAGFQAWLYVRKSRFGKLLTLSSQIRALNAVRMLFRFLVKTGRALNDFSSVLRLPKAPENLPANLLTPRQARKLLAQPDTATVVGFRDRTIFEVLYATGLRARELLGLKVTDVNLAEGTLWVRQGKGRRDRVLPLGESACRYLAEYIKNVQPILARGRTVEHLFLNSYGKPLGMPGLCSKMHIYTQRAGIHPAPGSKPVTVHAFRHTLATEMLKRGADLRHIQEMLGHLRLYTTQRYLHLVKNDLKRVQEQCHPREQTGLPPAAMKYRGFTSQPEVES